MLRKHIQRKRRQWRIPIPCIRTMPCSTPPRMSLRRCPRSNIRSEARSHVKVLIVKWPGGSVAARPFFDPCVTSTAQSPQTACFQHHAEQGVSAGISDHSFLRFWSLWAFTRLGDNFGCPSPHPKIPFPAASLGCAAPRLFRVESDPLKLPAPLSRCIPESLHPDAATHPTFSGCFNIVRCH